MKIYYWYLDRKHIEKESDKALLINVDIFKVWIPKKLCKKQEFGLQLNIYLREDATFLDLNSNQEIRTQDIVSYFKDNVRLSNKTLVENKQQQFREQYKAKYQQATHNTFIDRDFDNGKQEDFETPKWEFNEEDLI